MNTLTRIFNGGSDGSLILIVLVHFDSRVARCIKLKKVAIILLTTLYMSLVVHFEQLLPGNFVQFPGGIQIYRTLETSDRIANCLVHLVSHVAAIEAEIV